MCASCKVTFVYNVENNYDTRSDGKYVAAIRFNVEHFMRLQYRSALVAFHTIPKGTGRFVVISVNYE